MTVRKIDRKDPSQPPETTGDLIEEKVVAFAEQLGILVGTVQAKTEGWLDRKALSREVGRIRDSAAELFERVSREDASQPKPAPRQAAPQPAASQQTAPKQGAAKPQAGNQGAQKQAAQTHTAQKPTASKQMASPQQTASKPTGPKQAAASDSARGRGPVDAPGKRHRTPPPQEPLNKRMGEPEGKQMGQKGRQAGRRGVRGRQG